METFKDQDTPSKEDPTRAQIVEEINSKCASPPQINLQSPVKLPSGISTLLEAVEMQENLDKLNVVLRPSATERKYMRDPSMIPFKRLASLRIVEAHDEFSALSRHCAPRSREVALAGLDPQDRGIAAMSHQPYVSDSSLPGPASNLSSVVPRRRAAPRPRKIPSNPRAPQKRRAPPKSSGADHEKPGADQEPGGADHKSPDADQKPGAVEKRRRADPKPRRAPQKNKKLLTSTPKNSGPKQQSKKMDQLPELSVSNISGITISNLPPVVPAGATTLLIVF